MRLNKYLLYIICFLTSVNLFFLHLSSEYYFDYYIAITILIFTLTLTLKRNSIKTFFQTKSIDKYIDCIVYVLILLPFIKKDIYSNNLILGMAIVFVLGSNYVKRFFKKKVKTDDEYNGRNIRLKLLDNYGKYTTLACMILLVLIVELRLPSSKVYYFGGLVSTIMFLLIAIFQYEIEKAKMQK